MVLLSLAFLTGGSSEVCGARASGVELRVTEVAIEGGETLCILAVSSVSKEGMGA